MEPVTQDLAPLSIIRTETVLSKLPIHNLAKKGKVDIQITKRNSSGEIELKWEVSHADRWGQPRQLAYKVDSLIINRRIDEEGRPLPKVVKLGSLSQICKELGVPASGKNTNDLKKVMHQNAGTYISAKLNYRGTDGSERRLEAGFTRYGVIFTGEALPDGRTADAIYIILNDPYREVLNNAPVRPLNYEYLKELRPSAQRFYEIISYRIFAALKHNRPIAKISYSDYCTFSAQQRYYDHEHFRIQMYKIHKAHLDSGYLASVSYGQTMDGEGKPDWILCYVPGPKAKAEFLTFTQKRPAAQNLPPKAADVDASLMDELVRREISSERAQKLLNTVKPDQPVLDQLEWADYLIRQSPPGSIRNPPGFYISIIQENVMPPAHFESSRQRRARQLSQMEQDDEMIEQQQLQRAFDEYCQQEINTRLRNLPPDELSQAIEAKKQDFSRQYRGLLPDALAEIALGAIRAELAKTIPLMNFEEFVTRRGH